MATERKKKRKLWYEKAALIPSKGGVLVSAEQRGESGWNPGKGFKPVPSARRTRKTGTDKSAIIVLCGGEFRGHCKADGVGPDGLQVFKIRKCVSPSQDAIHGLNQRVANLADAKGGKKNNYRCTVCLREHSAKK